jgi:hypothetical protein
MSGQDLAFIGVLIDAQAGITKAAPSRGGFFLTSRHHNPAMTAPYLQSMLYFGHKQWQTRLMIVSFFTTKRPI